MREISTEQVIRVLASENPWWADKSSEPLPARGLRARLFLAPFCDLLRQTTFHRAILLMGPRRVGKTVMVHHAIDKLLAEDVAPEEILFVSIDHPVYTGRGLEDLISLGERARPHAGSRFRYVFFDEIQYLKEWEVHLKALVDRQPHLKLVASGSAAAALRLKSQESGAGRFTDFYLPPLTFREFLDLTGKHDIRDWNPAAQSSDVMMGALNDEFVRYVNYGGYPEVALADPASIDQGRFVKSDIIDKVLLRDLPSLYGIADVQELNHLFTTIAYNTGEEVSLERLSQSSGVAKNTIKRYLEYLEAAFLVRRVYRLDRSARRFKRETVFKVYLTNPSMRAALFGPVTAEDDVMGFLVETAFFAQWTESPERLFYARWGSDEVDVVSLGADARPAGAFELKWSDGAVRNAARELRVLAKFALEQSLPMAVCTTRSILAVQTVARQNVFFVPTAHLCNVIGQGQLQRRTNDTLARIVAEADRARTESGPAESQ